MYAIELYISKTDVAANINKGNGAWKNDIRKLTSRKFETATAERIELVDRLDTPLSFFCGHSDLKSGQGLQVDMISTGCSQRLKVTHSSQTGQIDSGCCDRSSASGEPV